MFTLSVTLVAMLAVFYIFILMTMLGVRIVVLFLQMIGCAAKSNKRQPLPPNPAHRSPRP